MAPEALNIQHSFPQLVVLFRGGWGSGFVGGSMSWRQARIPLSRCSLCFVSRCKLSACCSCRHAGPCPSATGSRNTLHRKLPWWCVLPQQQKADRRTLRNVAVLVKTGRGFYQLTLTLRQGSCESHRWAPNMSVVLLGTLLCPLHLMQILQR